MYARRLRQSERERTQKEKRFKPFQSRNIHLHTILYVIMLTI